LQRRHGALGRAARPFVAGRLASGGGRRRSGAHLVQFKQPRERIVLGDIGRPAIGGGDGGVEIAMRIESQAGRSL
jgi:hypothetical protein